ncbi:MAG: hypothetical protein ABI333_28140 [bacterium]
MGCSDPYHSNNNNNNSVGDEENTVAACQDGVDNDLDGLTDCADPECQGFGFCVESDCTNGLDDDNDGFADCLDTDCQPTIDCRENTAVACQDNIDNDGDGLTDCDDPDCDSVPICHQENTPAACDDGIDNDNDGDTDCDDSECASMAVCGGFCYDVTFQAPAVWGMAIKPVDDLDPSSTDTIQYQARIQALSPEAGTQVCLYLDQTSTTPLFCGDPNTTNPVVGQVDLDRGDHTFYARVEQGTDSCTAEEMFVHVWTIPSCAITTPPLSSSASSPTCWPQATMDVVASTNGARAFLEVTNAGTSFFGPELADAQGDVSFTGTTLGADNVPITMRAHCYNAGTDNGDSYSGIYYVEKVTQAPPITIVSPSSGAQFGAAQCPFTVTVTGVPAGETACANFVGQTPVNPGGCAVSTGPSQQIPLEVACVNGTDLTVEAWVQPACGPRGEDTILVSADTGAPTVLIVSPANGQTYNKADDANAATNSFEFNVTACTDGPYNPGDIVLRVDGVPVTAVTPVVQQALCLGTLSHTITWSGPVTFLQPTPLRITRTLEVEVFDGFNYGSASSTFQHDMIAPQLTFSCAGCEPTKDFFILADDNCAGLPVEIGARVQVTGLEIGRAVTLAVTNGGVPVTGSPYSRVTSTTSAEMLSFNFPCGVALQTGQNRLEATATDLAGNVAIPAVKLATYGDGFITSPASGAVLSTGDDCDGGAAFGMPVDVRVDHTTVPNGTAVEVVVSSSNGGWSHTSNTWIKSCTGNPCTTSFCVPVPAAAEQTDIQIVLNIAGTPVPGGPTGITIDVTDPDPPNNPTRTVVNRRAAEVQLGWVSVEDPQTGVLEEWDVRCVANATISSGNWAAAMQFAGEPTPAGAGTGQTMNISQDVNGRKLRAGSDYSCGIRGRNAAGLWSSIAIFPTIAAADIGFLQYPLVIEGYTAASTFDHYANIVAAGDLNGDSYDDMIVGYGSSSGHAVAIYFGSANGPTAANMINITCGDTSFGGAITAIGDFDGQPYSGSDTGLYPDFAISSPDEETVYIFRGHAALGSGALSCNDADTVITRSLGESLGNTLAAAGDFDNDGLNDLIIGSSTASANAGAVFVLFGRASLPATVNLVSGAGAGGALQFTPATADRAGSGVSGFDVDHDGASDLLFASQFGGSSGKGSVSVLLGFVPPKIPNTIQTITESALDQVIDIVPAGWVSPSFGAPSLSPMDFNGDGCTDLAVGVGRDTVSGFDAAGSVQVFFGEKIGPNCTGTLSSAVNVRVLGTAAWEQFGQRVANPLNLTTGTPTPWRLNGVLTSPSDFGIFTGARQYDILAAATTGPGFAGLWYVGFPSDVTSGQADVDFAPPVGAGAYHIATFVGDLDGDGYVDLAVGDSDYSTGGRIHIFR